jgi:hypothetical protein
VTSATDPSATDATDWRPSVPYRPLGRRANWTVALLVVGIVADVVAVGSDVAERLLLNDAASGGLITPDEAEANDLRQIAVGAVQGVLFILTATAFLFWFNRAYRNLTALGARDLRFGYGWAVGGWFVPILWLWRPKQIVNDIWRASDPEETPDQGLAWKDKNVPGAWTGWWIAWLFSGSLYWGATRSAWSAGTIDELLVSNAVLIAADVLAGLAGLLAVMFVRQTTARQTERAMRLDITPEEDPVPPWRRASAWIALAGAALALGVQILIAVAASSGTFLPEEAEPATPRAPTGTPAGTIFADDFSQRDVWLSETNETARVGYTGGSYSILVKEPGSLWTSLLGLGREVEALAVEADTTLHEGTVRGDFWGVVCLGSSEGVYLFGASPDGFYTIGFDPGGDAQLEFRRLVRNFARKRFGPDKGTNRLHAECIDDGDETLLRLYVDGVRQSEARHSGRMGRFIGIGLFVYSQSGGTDVRFDDVVVRPP